MSTTPTVYERLAPDPRVVDEALTSSRHAVFWHEDAPGTAYPPLTADTTADLTVVGGGYLGLWTAVTAKRCDPDRRVLLIEANQVGWAASGRNGGFCEASLTHGEDNGRSRWPGEYPLLEQLGRANLDDFEKDVADLGLDCQFERTGAMAVAVEEHQVAWLGGPGSPGHLDAAAVRNEIDSPIFRAGSWDRDGCALVHPARLANELARAANELGVEIHEHTRATSMRSGRRGGPVEIATTTDTRAGGTVRSRRVVLATNVFRSLLRRNRMMTVPVYDYVLMTEPLTPSQLASIGWRNRQGLADLANQFHYSRLTADNRILYGGYDAVYHPGGRIRAEYEVRDKSHRRLASHLLTTFPQLEGIRISHRWAGVIDTCTQFAPFFGLARQRRVAYAAGFTGLGVGSTRWAAQVMVDLVDGADTVRTGLDFVTGRPLPFPPEPLSSVGIGLTRWSLDRADHRHGRRNRFLRTLDRCGLGFDS